jgi:aldehyde dehydrogenase (NAD+)
MSVAPSPISHQRFEERLDAVLARQRACAPRLARSGHRERSERLRRIEVWIMAHRGRIAEALAADFRKPVPETDLTEVLAPVRECRYTRCHLRSWMRPRRVRPSLALLGSTARVRLEPRGTVLVLAPFNYPFLLCVHPLISALAAGNTVVLKPSEMTPRTARLIEEMVSELFPEEEVAVFTGGVEAATALLRRPFDHIFFTGSPRVGSVVMRAAAEHHATITLELGGKSPAVVDASADLRRAAEKIVWGRFQNAGQTCIAPDYVLVERRVEAPFLDQLRFALERLYGPEPDRRGNPDFARVIDGGHLERLRGLLEQAVTAGARIECGGECDPARLWFAPTLLAGVDPAMDIMQEEIFGPLLPVIAWAEPAEAVAVMRGLPRPLALYLFSGRRERSRWFTEEVPSGAVCVNDALVHFLHPGLPFGGVNTSGQGCYHGYFGFRELSLERAVLVRGPLDPLRLFLPPYGPGIRRLIELAVRYL